MRLSLVASTCVASLVLAQQPRDPRVADLVSANRLRVALFLPQFEKDSTTGELRGNPVYMEIVQALAARLGVPIQLAGFQTPALAVDALNQGQCDVAFMASNEPSRAAEVGFSPPVVRLDYTYLVPGDSPIRSINDVDREGTRIAVVRNHASTLALNGVLKRARQVTGEVPDEAFELLRTGRADAWAGVRSTLIPYAKKIPGSRLLADRYGANLIAIAVAKDQSARLAYVREFVEDARASGLIRRAIEHAGERGSGIDVADTRR